MSNDRVGNVKRAIMSLSMLALLIFQVFTSTNDVFRARRARRCRNEIEVIFDEEL